MFCVSSFLPTLACLLLGWVVTPSLHLLQMVLPDYMHSGSTPVLLRICQNAVLTQHLSGGARHFCVSDELPVVSGPLADRPHLECPRSRTGVNSSAEGSGSKYVSLFRLCATSQPRCQHTRAAADRGNLEEPRPCLLGELCLQTEGGGLIRPRAVGCDLWSRSRTQAEVETLLSAVSQWDRSGCFRGD